MAADERTLAALGGYLGRLLATNEDLNLTAVRDADIAWTKHLADSLSLAPHLRPLAPGRVLDLGSGGGLPGIPLAIAFPEVGFTLVDARAKKVAFLADVARELGLSNVTALADRAEALAARGSPHREAYDVVLARAVAPMPVLLELAIPFLRVGGHLLAIKGERYAEELAAAAKALAILETDVASTTRTETGTIVVLRKHARTPPKYPRRPGEPKKSPL